jgi:hypothetical protein
MGIGKVQFFYYLKISLFFVFILYVIFAQSNFSKLPSSRVQDFVQKEKLRKYSPIVLLGGSNVAFGLSAEDISKNYLDCINLGIISELGEMQDYFSWLKKGVRADIIVYSPSVIWAYEINFSSFRDTNSRVVKNVPPLISQFKAFYNLMTRENKSFTDFGDSKNLLGTKLTDYSIDVNRFISLDSYIINEILGRVQVLKSITGASKIYMRVPPIFITKNKKLYIELMQRRVFLLKKAGLTFVGSTFVSSESELFEDNIHPSMVGRTHFTNEVISTLVKI